MARALRGRTRDLVAVIVLLVAGLATTLVIISQQKAALPGWVPLFGQDFFERQPRTRAVAAGRLDHGASE